ncbi:MAG: metallophosphoesterase family protein [Terriglobia bacterium]
MSRMKQFRNPKLSIWQSAVDEAIARRAVAAQAAAPAGAPAAKLGRPDAAHRMVRESASYCSAIAGEKSFQQLAATPLPPEGLLHTLSYCSVVALKLAKAAILGNQQDYETYKSELGKFTDCDPLYLQATERYVEYFIAQCKKIPYRAYKNLSDFVIDGKLPGKARVAILGDWGTGEEVALKVLRQIAAKKPDVVIHLGDVYYSGTEFEDQSYFFQPWTEILNLAQTKIPTFTLSGNHDMYSGGVGYYKLIEQLGQPASYFCLRNDDWQFLAMDTGLHDNNPAEDGSAATYLEDTELAWHDDKMKNAGSRRTILLSHHPLMSAYEPIDGHEVNMRLQPQVFSFLPNVALWLWGHEHNFVVYGPFGRLQRGRCLGHAAFPVGVDELPSAPIFSNVPVITKDSSGKSIKLGQTDGLYNHGYAILDLDGASGAIAYYQDTDEQNPLFAETI